MFKVASHRSEKLLRLEMYVVSCDLRHKPPRPDLETTNQAGYPWTGPSTRPRAVLVVTHVTVRSHLLSALLMSRTLFNSENFLSLFHRFHFTETVTQGNHPESF